MRLCERACRLVNYQCLAPSPPVLFSQGLCVREREKGSGVCRTVVRALACEFLAVGLVSD